MTNARTKTSSNDIAREALRALVARRLEPTPDNYRIHYNQIAGLEPEPEKFGATQVLRQIVTELARGSPELQRIAKGLERAQANDDWAQSAALFQ